jgi:trypsin
LSQSVVVTTAVLQQISLSILLHFPRKPKSTLKMWQLNISTVWSLASLLCLWTESMAVSSSDKNPNLLRSHRSLIVGGEPVASAKEAYPAFAWSGITAAGWGCGGALVHSDFVLTAAHCKWAFYDTMQLKLGAYQIDNGDHTGQVVDILRIIPHPDFVDGNPLNDIMLVQLWNASDAKPFEYNRDHNFPAAMTEPMTTMGFGTTEEGGTVSQILRSVDVYAFTYQDCLTTYPNAVDDLQLCAGTVEGGKDGCDSDSGSPYIVDNTVVAITDDGIGCGHANVPSINARVSGYADWIHENICHHSRHAPKSCKDGSWNMTSEHPHVYKNDTLLPPPSSKNSNGNPVIEPKTTHRKMEILVIVAASCVLIGLAVYALQRQKEQHKRSSYTQLPTTSSESSLS